MPENRWGGPTIRSCLAPIIPAIGGTLGWAMQRVTQNFAGSRLEVLEAKIQSAGESVEVGTKGLLEVKAKLAGARGLFEAVNLPDINFVTGVGGVTLLGLRMIDSLFNEKFYRRSATVGIVVDGVLGAAAFNFPRVIEKAVVMPEALSFIDYAVLGLGMLGVVESAIGVSQVIGQMGNALTKSETIVINQEPSSKETDEQDKRGLGRTKVIADQNRRALERKIAKAEWDAELRKPKLRTK